MPRSLSSSLVASFQFVGLAQVHDIAHGHIEFQSPTLKHDYFCVFFIYQSTNSQNWINAFSAQAQRPRLSEEEMRTVEEANRVASIKACTMAQESESEEEEELSKVVRGKTGPRPSIP